MSDCLSSFAELDPNKDFYNGFYILRDFLFLPVGSMPAQENPPTIDRTVALLEDCQGLKMEMNCYGDPIEQLAAITRDTIISLTNFTTGHGGAPSLYKGVEFTGYIRNSGSVARRGPGTRLYSLEEVQTNIGRFILELEVVDPEMVTSVGSFVKTHWRTSSDQSILITAYRENMDRLEGFNLETGRVYANENAAPYPSSRFASQYHASAHFTVSTATSIQLVHI